MNREQLLAYTARAIKAGAQLADLKIPATNEPRPVTQANIEELAVRYVDEALQTR